MEIKFNYFSKRSEKSRIAVNFNGVILPILYVVAAVLLIAGAYLIFIKLSIGWLLVGFAFVPVMVIEWYRDDLSVLDASKKPESIDDLLSFDVLGRLSKNPTPREIATIISEVPGGHFFAVRFGISPRFLKEITSNNSDDIKTVWQEAWSIRNQTGSKTISAAVLVVALVRSASNHLALLSHLQLTIDDLIDGVNWFNHLNYLIDRKDRIVKTGGIARDWSFGWTPLLDRFGYNISRQIKGDDIPLVRLAAHEDSLERLFEIFSKKGRQNAVLVGPIGVGKTEIINVFATKLLDGSMDLPVDLKYRQVFMLDAASLIASARNHGDLERIVPNVISEAYGARNIIVCLDNAHLFFEDGIGSVDISNILMPILEVGKVRMILIMDEQQFLKLSNRNTELIKVLNRVNVNPATREESISVMQDKSVAIEFQNHVTFMHQAFIEAYRLGERYVYDLAMPGKALSLLESAASFSENGMVTASSVRQSVEKTLNIKVNVVADDSERDKLLNLEDLIHRRVINQSGAVSAVCDALRRARVGVRSQNKPIGTFLFLGPTGVGKTELAKSLADIYFDGEDHLVRFDMNEFSAADDVSRLIADSSSNANSLTARVIKQPFCVVLLDEIEKAHPNVLATLLQALDEGILRDVSNREVSFRDTIIIATSNAGADRVREYIDRGYDIEQNKTKFVDDLIKRRQFRPEFLNRFDEIVMFSPLNRDELLKVIDLILASVNRTLSLQDISVKVSDEAKKYLVENGYDPQFGARPMRRIIQRSVENIIAKKMLSKSVKAGSVIPVELEQVKQILDSKIISNS